MKFFVLFSSKADPLKSFFIRNNIKLKRKQNNKLPFLRFITRACLMETPPNSTFHKNEQYLKIIWFADAIHSDACNKTGTAKEVDKKKKKKLKTKTQYTYTQK